METGFDVYYCTVCHVCKSPPNLQEAKFCSVCKLVQYCCSLHQKEDWPNHKEFCKCIQKILKKWGTNHVFEQASDRIEQNGENWIKLRSFLVMYTKQILNRPLTLIETQMLLFPPVCNLCYCYKPNQMISCYTCNTVMYCCVGHQTIDEKHKNVCKLLFQSMKIDLKRFFLQNDVAYNFSMLNDFKLKGFKQFPSCMERFFKNNGKNLSSEEMLLSEPLSYSLTFAYVVSCVTKMTDDSLTVHIIGADAMELLALKTLPVIFNLLPHLNSLKIVLIGPNLPDNVSVPTQIHDNCSLHMVNNTYYHEYTNKISSSLTNPMKPDVIVVFNCGFCEFIEDPEKDNWRNSLPCILSFQNSTVILTSYTETESVSDLKRLVQSKKKDELSYEVLLESKLNLFGSCYPHRDWEEQNGGVFYVNKYVSVLKIK